MLRGLIDGGCVDYIMDIKNSSKVRHDGWGAGLDIRPVESAALLIERGGRKV